MLALGCGLAGHLLYCDTGWRWSALQLGRTPSVPQFTKQSILTRGLVLVRRTRASFATSKEWHFAAAAEIDRLATRLPHDPVPCRIRGLDQRSGSKPVASRRSAGEPRAWSSRPRSGRDA